MNTTAISTKICRGLSVPYLLSVLFGYYHHHLLIEWLYRIHPSFYLHYLHLYLCVCCHLHLFRFYFFVAYWDLNYFSSEVFYEVIFLSCRLLRFVKSCGCESGSGCVCWIVVPLCALCVVVQFKGQRDRQDRDMI